MKVKKEKKILFYLTEESQEKMLLPGAMYETIREKHSLFFTYDPRGTLDSDERYCRDCRCPKNYCSNIVLGPVAKIHCESWIDESPDGIMHVGYSADSLHYNFTRAYAFSLFSKMRDNRIPIPPGYDDTDEKKVLKLPKCVERGSFKLMFQKYKKMKPLRFMEPNDLEDF